MTMRLKYLGKDRLIRGSFGEIKFEEDGTQYVTHELGELLLELLPRWFEDLGTDLNQTVVSKEDQLALLGQLAAKTALVEPALEPVTEGPEETETTLTDEELEAATAPAPVAAPEPVTEGPKAVKPPSKIQKPKAQ